MPVPMNTLVKIKGEDPVVIEAMIATARNADVIRADLDDPEYIAIYQQPGNNLSAVVTMSDMSAVNDLPSLNLFSVGDWLFAHAPEKARFVCQYIDHFVYTDKNNEPLVGLNMELDDTFDPERLFKVYSRALWSPQKEQPCLALLNSNKPAIKVLPLYTRHNGSFDIWACMGLEGEHEHKLYWTADLFPINDEPSESSMPFVVSTETQTKLFTALSTLTPLAITPQDKLCPALALATDAIACYRQEQSEQQERQIYREIAKTSVVDGVLELDCNANVSRGDSKGAYVACWLWVDDDDIA